MRRTFTDDRFDEWEAFVSGGQPGGSQAARILFNCISTPGRRPRYVVHASGDPAAAEQELYNMDDAGVIELFESSEELA
jgi:hypothetical protein